MAIATPNAISYIQQQKNQPNGIVGINADGTIAATVAHRTGAASVLSSIILASGELAYATDTKEMFVGNGETAGGIFFHAAPVTKTKYHASLLSEASTEASQFNVSKNGTYTVDIGGLVNTPGESISNFSIQFPVDGSIIGEFEPTFPGSLSGHRLFASATWANASTGVVIESKVYNYTVAGFPLSVFMTDQSLSSARFHIQLYFKAKEYGTVSVKLAARTTPPASGDGYYFASLRRIG